MEQDYKKQIVIDGHTIDLPLTYQCEAINLAFSISTAAAKEAIACPQLKPLEIFPSRCLLVVTLFNFSETPVGPYTEITYSIAANYNKTTIPFFSFLSQIISADLSFYVYTIAQSTEIAIKHGNTINGYPHFSELISSEYGARENELSVKVECGGEKVLSLDLIKPKKMKHKDELFTTYKVQNNNLSSLLMETHGKGGGAKVRKIEFGKHKLAEMLRELGVGKKVLDARYYSDTTKIINEQKVVSKIN